MCTNAVCSEHVYDLHLRPNFSAVLSMLLHAIAVTAVLQCCSHTQQLASVACHKLL